MEKVRQNVNIKGIKVGDNEFEVSEYADDALCFLDGSVNSCRALFDDLGIFAKFSGLKPNIGKTEAFWAGADAENMPPICENLNFRWVKKLKVLGVFFANDESSVVKANFESKLTQAEMVIKGKWYHQRKDTNNQIVGAT